jgi:hypothetical protein
MRGCNVLLTALVLTLSGPVHAQAVRKAKPKVSPATAQLQAQVKKLTEERDDLKDRLAATGNLQEDLAAAQKSRDLAREETDNARKELEQIKNSLAENQGSSDTILAELQKTKADLATAQASNEGLRKSLAAAREKQAAVAEATPVVITPDIVPAKPMNVSRITPSVKKVSRGVVVVNVLVSENGEVLETSLLQGLPGQGQWVDKANQACVDAAKRLVFDPARTADGKSRVRVWQGVGFLLD